VKRGQTGHRVAGGGTLQFEKAWHTQTECSQTTHTDKIASRQAITAF